MSHIVAKSIQPVRSWRVAETWRTRMAFATAGVSITFLAVLVLAL